MKRCSTRCVSPAALLILVVMAGLIGFGSQHPAHAAPLRDDFADSWRQARYSYRHGDFPNAYRAFVPLVSTGTALDDPAYRLRFYVDAASAYCLAGLKNEMLALVNSASPFLAGMTEEQRQAIPDAMSRIGDLLALSIGTFDFRTSFETDVRLFDGVLRDHNKNGRVDDGPYEDIDGRTVPVGALMGPGASWNLRDAANAVSPCDNGISLYNVGPIVGVQRSGVTRVRLRCAYVVPCAGKAEVLLGRYGRRAVASAPYVVGAQEQVTVQLRPTALGRSLSKKRRTEYRARFSAGGIGSPFKFVDLQIGRGVIKPYERRKLAITLSRRECRTRFLRVDAKDVRIESAVSRGLCVLSLKVDLRARGRRDLLVSANGRVRRHRRAIDLSRARPA